MKLYSLLESFDYSHSNDTVTAWSELSTRFAEIARAMMYGGYIEVYGVYRVYIRGVELYFHEENGSLDDSIVYHRNGHNRLKDLNNVPVFPIMSLHAHNSGFDITFEKDGVRASALIRKYAVYDLRNKEFICRPKPKSAPKSCVEWEDYRSTLLYDILNGFSLTPESSIVWRDVEIGIDKSISEPMVRINTRDDRKWRFIATEDIRNFI